MLGGGVPPIPLFFSVSFLEKVLSATGAGGVYPTFPFPNGKNQE